MNQPERRKSQRVSIEMSVGYEVDGERRDEKIGNASLRGFFVLTSQPVPVGSTLVFRLGHEEMEVSLEVLGRVVHHSSKDFDGADGMGVAITRLTQGQDQPFECYRSLIEKRLLLT